MWKPLPRDGLYTWAVPLHLGLSQRSPYEIVRSSMLDDDHGEPIDYKIVHKVVIDPELLHKPLAEWGRWKGVTRLRRVDEEFADTGIDAAALAYVAQKTPQHVFVCT